MLVFWGGNWICFAAHGSHLFRVQKHEFIVHVPLAALVNWPGNKFTRISTIPGSISEVENGGGPPPSMTPIFCHLKKRKKKTAFTPKNLGGNSCTKKSSHSPYSPFPPTHFPTPHFPNRDLVGTGNHKHTRSFLLAIEKVRNPRFNRFWWDGYTPRKLRLRDGAPQVMEEVLDSSDEEFRSSILGWVVFGGTLAVNFSREWMFHPEFEGEWLALGRRLAPHAFQVELCWKIEWWFDFQELYCLNHGCTEKKQDPGPQKDSNGFCLLF